MPKRRLKTPEEKAVERAVKFRDSPDFDHGIEPPPVEEVKFVDQDELPTGQLMTMPRELLYAGPTWEEYLGAEAVKDYNQAYFRRDGSAHTTDDMIKQIITHLPRHDQRQIESLRKKHDIYALLALAKRLKWMIEEIRRLEEEINRLKGEG